MALRMTDEEYAEWTRRRARAEMAAPLPSPSSPRPPEAEGTGKRRNKYNNRRVEVDGLKFDSIHEAQVYQELMLRVKAGELRCVQRQVAFDLPGGIRYIADFAVIDNDMRVEFYDAKSPATRKNRVYINKKKQVKALWGIEIREV